jgi:hypothetical protein
VAVLDGVVADLVGGAVGDAALGDQRSGGVQEALMRMLPWLRSVNGKVADVDVEHRSVAEDGLLSSSMLDSHRGIRGK